MFMFNVNNCPRKYQERYTNTVANFNKSIFGFTVGCLFQKDGNDALIIYYDFAFDEFNGFWYHNNRPYGNYCTRAKDLDSLRETMRVQIRELKKESEWSDITGNFEWVEFDFGA